MNKKEKKVMLQRMWRWSLVSFIAIGLFWLFWYLSTGEVPVVREIQITKEWTLTLPFGISRWWDMLIGPIWSVSLATTLTTYKDRYITLLIMVVGFAIGSFFGLPIWWFVEPIMALTIGLLSWLIIGIAVGLLDTRLESGLNAGLSFSLTFGLTIGLGIGLVVGLGFVLFCGLITTLVWLLQIKLSFWQWFSAVPIKDNPKEK